MPIVPALSLFFKLLFLQAKPQRYITISCQYMSTLSIVYRSFNLPFLTLLRRSGLYPDIFTQANPKFNYVKMGSTPCLLLQCRRHPGEGHRLWDSMANIGSRILLSSTSHIYSGYYPPYNPVPCIYQHTHQKKTAAEACCCTIPPP